MAEAKTLGVIGGSGLYDLPDLSGVERVEVDTPFGPPSDAYVRGRLGEVTLVFLPRHGVGHRILPSELNARANIYGFKVLGVERILSISAVGSLREEIAPGDVVCVDQFLDRTRGRPSTFFGEGIAAHVAFGDPVCGQLHPVLVEAARAACERVHPRGTYVCMEGPAFSTRAESLFHRSLGADVIGMTNLPEAKLAREAEICYVTLALSTDYDAWREDEAAVSVDAVLEILRANVERARETIRQLARRLPAERCCACKDALAHAIMTPAHLVPEATRARLEPIIGRYLGPEEHETPPG